MRSRVTGGFPHDVSVGTASSVLPRFQPGCIALTYAYIAVTAKPAGAREHSDASNTPAIVNLRNFQYTITQRDGFDIAAKRRLERRGELSEANGDASDGTSAPTPLRTPNPHEEAEESQFECDPERRRKPRAPSHVVFDPAGARIEDGSGKLRT